MDAHLEMKPLGGVVAACLLAAGIVTLLPLSKWPSALGLAVDGVVFAGAYLTLAPLLRAIKEPDANRLVVATEHIRFVGVVMKSLMAYEMRLLHLVHSGSAVPTKGA